MSDNEYSVSVVSLSAEFANLHDPWNELLRSSHRKSICLTWEWLHTWWEVYGEDGMRLHIIVVRLGDIPVGIAPFWIQTAKRAGLIPIRTLRFLGTGEPDAVAVVSEYLDIIARPEHTDEVVRQVCKYLGEHRIWDRMVLCDVLKDALVLTCLRDDMFGRGVPSFTYDKGVRYAVELPGTWAQYASTLDPGAARRVSYKRRKFERAGRVLKHVISRGDELDRAFEDLARLHGAQWHAKGMPGVFESVLFKRFHRALAAHLLPLGSLNLMFVSLDDIPVAALYNFRWENVEYFYQGGIDIERAGKYSPGTVIHAYAIESAIQNGIVRYDMMRGHAGSYKTEFGCTKTSMFDMHLFGRTLIGRTLYFAVLARNRLRDGWRNRVGPVQAAP